MNEFWNGLSRKAKIGVAGGTITILLMLATLSWYLLRVEYQVLFADLKPQDAQAMTAELERLKIPYKLADSGTSILVDQASVHNTRIKLMGKDFPLHGAVGFELFNNTDFGMTEFAQKINYQRALQGELTRTILSLAEIRDARVHLALPEQSLFKQATARAKASISLTVREGQTLRQEQVTGIQRLVAAAVPGMGTQDVTIVDHRGVALTRSVGAEGESDTGSTRLDLKRDTESYLTRKAGAVLDKVFGPGQALVSVDVTLNMEQMRVTTEDVIASPSKSGAVATGVVIRERESIRDVAPPLDSRSSSASRTGNHTQRDVDYAVGRRVEQIVGQPGSIRSIHAVVVVRQALDGSGEEKIHRLLSVAVGAIPERGDTIVVQSMSAPLSSSANNPAARFNDTDKEASSPQVPSAQSTTETADKSAPLIAGAAITLALLAIGLVSLRQFHAKRSAKIDLGAVDTPLTDAQRAAALERIQQWMQSGAATGSWQGSSGLPPQGTKA